MVARCRPAVAPFRPRSLRTEGKERSSFWHMATRLAQPWLPIVRSLAGDGGVASGRLRPSSPEPERTRSELFCVDDLVFAPMNQQRAPAMACGRGTFFMRPRAARRPALRALVGNGASFTMGGH